MCRNHVVRWELQSDRVAVGLVGSPARTAICAPGGSIGGASPHVASLSSARTCVFCEFSGLTSPPNNRTATAVIIETVVFIIPPYLFCIEVRYFKGSETYAHSSTR